jgi:hypothetical protein
LINIVIIVVIIVVVIIMLNREKQPEYEFPALCIPRALGKITQEEIYAIIRTSGLGDVHKIVIKPKEFILPKWERTAAAATSTTTAPTAPTETVCYNNIYIYFKKWNTNNPNVKKYRDNIMNGQTIKIVHNAIPTPIFWRCVAANFTTYRNKQINKIDI